MSLKLMVVPLVVPLATTVPPRRSSTVAPVVTPEMSKVGLVTLVILSVLLVPESLAACKSGAFGAEGADIGGDDGARVFALRQHDALWRGGGALANAFENSHGAVFSFQFSVRSARQV